MQSKVLCLLSVAVFASCVAAANLPQGDVTVNNGSNNQMVPSVVIPTIPNIVPLPDLEPAIVQARKLVETYLGTTENFSVVIQDIVNTALKSDDPCSVMINEMGQILDAYNRVASASPIQVGLLVLNEGLKMQEKCPFQDEDNERLR
ncbi:hypothetical protein QLX08_010998 [Tetragonisca angustula]|uniref:Uncharacterized protein n=1 Tax=Tetragonisca angustula TaxID=166442 RepID=A0AAW0Z9Y3_9HYME